MTCEIYWGSGSPYAWRVLLALEVKRVPYVSRVLEFSKGQHEAPEFLALNPRGKVPALRDGDYVLWESLAILAYLDRKHPEPPLYGRTPEAAGEISRRIAEFDFYIQPKWDRVVTPLAFGGAAEKADDIRAAAAELRTELADLEAAVARHGWLADSALSAADLAVYPFLEFLLRQAGKEAAQPLALGLLPFAERYPALAAWRERIKALPGYDRTYPPHWRG